MTETTPILPPAPASGGAQQIPLSHIFLAFTRSAMMSIGGGLAGWMMREFVEQRKWLTETEFLTGLAMAQALPGVNVVNLSIWVGFRLRGGRGALVAALGMIVLPGVLAIIILSVFDRFAQHHIVGVVLAGIAAAAIGLSLQMGIKAVRATGWHIAPLAIIAAMIVALFFLKWPLLPVLLVLVPISIAIAFWRLRNGEQRP